MDLRASAAERAFRGQVRAWLDDHCVGEFARWKGRGGIGRDEIPVEVQLAWERELAAGGWVGLGYPAELGGRPATLTEQVAFHEEYVRSGAPARLGNIGVTLLGPTLLAFASAEQQQRFVPPILRCEELWCQGYSEPDAGSDLASLRTRAWRDGDEWVIEGQKVWTTLAHLAQWCFVLCRTDTASQRHEGLSYLLVPMAQPGIEVRPIRQPTGSSEFSELFFHGARTRADLVVGAVGAGWRVAMGTLGFERGVGSLGLQLSFVHELETVIALARKNGAIGDPVVRDEIVRSWIGLQIMRASALRSIGSQSGAAPSISKLYWSTWYQRFGELALRVRGASAMIAETSDEASPPFDGLQQLFLFGRAVTIFAGSSEIQRNILGESVLGLPREPRGRSVTTRRIVTIDDGNGRGVVESDSPPALFGGVDSAEGVEIEVMWVITDGPPDLSESVDIDHPAWSLGPVPVGGSRWSMLTFHPGARARGMHRTQTIDFVQVISGEIHLVLGGGDERRLGPGDTVVQRGATHAWENRSDEPCVMSAIMLTAR